MKYYVSAWNVDMPNDPGREYGPFTKFQITYDLLRVDPECDRELAIYDGREWVFTDNGETFNATDWSLRVMKESDICGEPDCDKGVSHKFCAEHWYDVQHGTSRYG